MLASFISSSVLLLVFAIFVSPRSPRAACGGLATDRRSASRATCRRSYFWPSRFTCLLAGQPVPSCTVVAPDLEDQRSGSVEDRSAVSAVPMGGWGRWPLGEAISRCSRNAPDLSALPCLALGMSASSCWAFSARSVGTSQPCSFLFWRSSSVGAAHPRSSSVFEVRGGGPRYNGSRSSRAC